jgi:serine/threonine protein kinase
VDVLSRLAGALPDFDLQAIIGSGATSTVVRAVDKSGSSVAIKVFSEDVKSSDSFKKLASREVSNLKKLKGDRTSKVLSANLDSDVPYIVMELVKGDSLASTVAKKTLTGALLQTVVESLVEAVDEVHQAGVTHRDLKPANVLFGEDGIKVVDFGISASEDASATTNTSFSGTPGWTSPEQAVGDTVGPATDIFNLGLLIAYASTSKHAFGEGRPDAMLFRIVNSEPELDQVPDRYRDVVAACLQKEPSERPSIKNLLKALRQGASGENHSDGTRIASQTLLLENSKLSHSPMKARPFLSLNKKTAKKVALLATPVFLVGALLCGFFLPASGPLRVDFVDEGTIANPAKSTTTLKVRSGNNDPVFHALPSVIAPSTDESFRLTKWSRGKPLLVELLPEYDGDQPLTFELDSVGSGFFANNAEVNLAIVRSDSEITVEVTDSGPFFGLFGGRVLATESSQRGNEKIYLAEQRDGFNDCHSQLAQSWRTDLAPITDMWDEYDAYYSSTRFHDGLTLYNDQWSWEASKIADNVFSLSWDALPYSPDQRASRSEPYSDSIVLAARQVFLISSNLGDAWENLSYQLGNETGAGDLRELQPRAWMMMDLADDGLRDASNNVSSEITSESRSICVGKWPDAG